MMKKDFFYRLFLIPSLMVIVVFGLLYLMTRPHGFFSTIGSKDQMSHVGESGYDQYPAEWAWERRTFPYYKADAAYFRQEMKKAQKMKAASPKRGIQEVTFAGPTNIGGRMTDVEFNPVNPNVVYAGAATGGVFKSSDQGVTWIPIFDEQANLSVGDIGLDPNNPDIIYVGTGEANGGHNNFPGGGIYKSSDAGAHWQLLGLENTVSIGRVIVDPNNSNRIFVAAEGSYFTPNPERGVYRSDDGGATWQNVLFVNDSTGVIDMVLDPINSNRLIVSTWERVRRPEGSHLYGPSSGLYQSLNGGDSWSYIDPATAGLPNAQLQNVGRIGLALCASQPDIVYAEYTDGSAYLGLYKSVDFGETWINADPDMEISEGVSTFSWYFGQVRVHPNNPDIVYVLDVAFMRSTDGGATWPLIYGYSGGPYDFHVDQHALALNPNNPDYLICGNDGGLFISSNGGVNLSKVADLPVSQFYEIGLDRNNPNRMYGGLQDNGTVRRLDANTNNWQPIYGGDGFYVIVDYTNPDIIYAESQFGALGRSTDGGYYFNSATYGINSSEPTNWSTPVVMDPHNPNMMYYGTNHVYRSTDGANYWMSISPDLTNGMTGNRPGTISSIDVSPQNSNIIWVGTSDSKVWVSSDYGNNWLDVSASLPSRWVSRVVADPLEENTAYVTFTGLKWADPEPHVFRTTNSGESWEDISSNLPNAPVNALAVDPIMNNYLFVGTDLGVYYSDDFGANWEYIDADFPLVTTYDLKIHSSDHYLAIGTYGRSMYKLDLSVFIGVEEPLSESQNSIFQMGISYPNPFKSTTTIPIILTKKMHVQVDIYDMQNREVRSLFDAEMSEGEHHIGWDGTGQNGRPLPKAYYLCRIEAGGQSSSQKILLLK